jgi:hypothetical protein
MEAVASDCPPKTDGLNTTPCPVGLATTVSVEITVLACK